MFLFTRIHMRYKIKYNNSSKKQNAKYNQKNLYTIIIVVGTRIIILFNL